MPRQSTKHGTSGASKAMHCTYRQVGGTRQHPLIHPPNCRYTGVNASSPKETSLWEFGMLGGVLAARLGYHFEGEKQWVNALDGGKNVSY